MRNPCKSEIVLFNLLSSGQTLTVETALEKVGCSKSSLAVYIHNLREMYKANVSTIREGKKAVSYVLTNWEDETIKTKFIIQKKTKKTSSFNSSNKAVDVKTIASSELPVGGPIPYGDREVSDIMDSLGIGH